MVKRESDFMVSYPQLGKKVAWQFWDEMVDNYDSVLF